MCIMWKWNNILRPLSQISKTLINAHNNYYTHTNVTVLILCMYIAYNMYRACSKFYLVCYAALAYKAKLLYIHRQWAQPLSPLCKDKGGGGLEPAEPYASYASGRRVKAFSNASS